MIQNVLGIDSKLNESTHCNDNISVFLNLNDHHPETYH